MDDGGNAELTLSTKVCRLVVSKRILDEKPATNNITRRSIWLTVELSHTLVVGRLCHSR